jgi:hypothetical protein
MAVSRSINKKAPSQNPVDFFECKQHGGADAGTTKAQHVPDKLSSGSQREKIYGRANLSKSGQRGT